MIAVSRVTTSTGVELRFKSGNVFMDSRRNITRTADLELIPDGSFTAETLFNLLMTPDLEVVIERGLRLADGTDEYVSLGVFSTDTAEYSADVNGTIRWSGSDRSKKISRSKFIDPYQIPSGTTLATAATNLLKSRWVSTPVSFANVTETINTTITWDAGESTDPWAVARELFSDYGYDLSFDGFGTARAIALSDPAEESPVFDYGEGDSNLILDATILGSFEKTYNGVIVSGEGTNVAAPVRAEVWDTDPSSPTYYLGSFGRVPYFYSSPLLTTTGMCSIVGNAILSIVKGKTESLNFPTIVNPALEPLDVISLTFNGITQRAVLDQLTIPLQATEPMTATARETSTA